jgi:hypothetical protein
VAPVGVEPITLGRYNHGVTPGTSAHATAQWFSPVDHALPDLLTGAAPHSPTSPL